MIINCNFHRAAVPVVMVLTRAVKYLPYLMNTVCSLLLCLWKSCSLLVVSQSTYVLMLCFGILLFFVAGTNTLIAEESTLMQKEAVVLLHGLARTKRSMSPLERSLATQYKVCNIGYSSRKFSVEKLAEQAISSALAECGSGRVVHFVSHSMGGILIRQYLAKHTVKNMGRVVMLGPPNQGSEAVDALMRVPGFELWNGVAGTQLGAADGGFIDRLPEPEGIEIGVIAGNRAVTPFLGYFLPEPNDGKVSVESTKLSNMADFIEMPVTHTFMMRNKKVIAQVRHFLSSGHFRH